MHEVGKGFTDAMIDLRRQQEAALRHGRQQPSTLNVNGFTDVDKTRSGERKVQVPDQWNLSAAKGQSQRRQRRPRIFISLLDFDVEMQEQQEDAEQKGGFTGGPGGRIWTHPCRCGQEFVVEDETDLISTSDSTESEIVVECDGCGELIGLEDVKEALTEEEVEGG